MCWLLGCLAFVSTGAYATSAQGKEETLLDLKVKYFKVEDVSMFKALERLRLQNPSEILIGFEEVPTLRHEQHAGISLERTNTSVREIVEALIASDPRYSYELIGKTLINVMPKGAKKDPNNLLNIFVSKFSVDKEITIPALVHSVDEYSPELQSLLAQKRRDHYEALKRAGKVPGGTAGSIISGNAPKPRVTLELKNITVREILNSIILYSAEHADVLLPGWGNGVSWRYQFVMDANASTGLGGFPRWSIF